MGFIEISDIQQKYPGKTVTEVVAAYAREKGYVAVVQ
jgi:hypothetical protein